MLDPICSRPGCDAPNHCDHHDRPVHHPVDSMARHCDQQARRPEAGAA